MRKEMQNKTNAWITWRDGRVEDIGAISIHYN